VQIDDVVLPFAAFGEFGQPHFFEVPDLSFLEELWQRLMEQIRIGPRPNHREEDMMDLMALWLMDSADNLSALRPSLPDIDFRMFDFSLEQLTETVWTAVRDDAPDVAGHIVTHLFQLFHMRELLSDSYGEYIKERIESHHRKNSQHSQTIMERGFIYCQWYSPQGELLIGPSSTGGPSGCGPFAVYNALFHLRGGTSLTPVLPSQRRAIAEDPADIIKFLELNGGVLLGGQAGTNPEVLAEYMRNLGYIVPDINYLPRNINTRIQAADATIFLYYWGWEDIGWVIPAPMLHYAMIWYDRDAEIFWIYNEFTNDYRARYIECIEYHIEYHNYTSFALISIWR